MVDADDCAAVTAASVAGSPAVLSADEDAIAHARLQTIDGRRRRDGAAQVRVTVDIEPQGASPFAPGPQTLFMDLVRADGGWLVAEWGTGP
jgi:hypothetical protein